MTRESAINTVDNIPRDHYISRIPFLDINAACNNIICQTYVLNR